MSDTRTTDLDLAAERLGSEALLANDEFFAEKENLLKPGRGVFIAGKYTERGKWMDGWETRRRRQPGHDWCVVRLGLAGRIRQVVVDTHHFKGNHPEACSLDACCVDEALPAAELAAQGERWSEIVSRTPLAPDSENRFLVADTRRFTHVRLNIYPDGGVARLRVYGEVRPLWQGRDPQGLHDLLAVENGGVPLASSDQFFSAPWNLLMPGRGADMGDGWETRRRRGPGHDWVVLRLGRRGVLERVVVDTRHFKGNYPESCSLEGCDLGEASAGDAFENALAALPDSGVVTWRELVPRTPLGPDAEHGFDVEPARGPFTHVRLAIYPDGGVSRLRLFGRLAVEEATP